MNLLNDIITYVRRIIKSPSNAVISDNLIIDYINRFWIMDVDARIQLFDLKTKYQFQTTPGVDRYNMPLYNVQVEGGQSIGIFPVYQGFLGPAFINGIEVPFQTEQNSFFNIWPNIVQNMPAVATGNGSSGPYTFTFPIAPNNTTPINPPLEYIPRGHIDITGIIATGNNQDPPFGNNLNTSVPFSSIDASVFITSLDANGNNIVVSDSGQFLNDGANKPNYGLLMSQVPATNNSLFPNGYSALPNGYLNSFSITGVSQATQAVITASTNFQAGQIVTISGVVGMTQLNGLNFTVVSVTPTTVTINVNSTSFTPYISGGTISSLQNVVNYVTGSVQNIFFPTAVQSGANINAQCFFFQTGLPRSILYYNNVLTFRSPPDRQYLVELDAYLSPAAFMNTSSAIPFGYMAEYIARGAARKILADTGDVEQFQFYEPFFREQEILVWKRSQRQWTSTRTQTIYSQGINQGQSGFNNIGGSTI